MALTTTQRERLLWLSTLGVVLAIYATLDIARDVVEALRERNLLRLAVGSVAASAAVAVGVRAARRRPGRLELAVALCVGLVYLGAFLAMVRAEERLHLVEYGLVALLAHAALVEREQNGGGTLVPPWLGAMVLTTAFGWIDEGIQEILPSRVYDLRDVGFNAAAGVLAVSASLALGAARRRDVRGR